MKQLIVLEEFFRSLGLTTRLHEEISVKKPFWKLNAGLMNGAKYGENENVTGAVARKILRLPSDRFFDTVIR